MVEKENARESVGRVTKLPKTRKNSGSSRATKSTIDKNHTTLKVNGHILRLTNQEKVYWPKDGYTKGDVLEYYNTISKYNINKDGVNGIISKGHKFRN